MSDSIPICHKYLFEDLCNKHAATGYIFIDGNTVEGLVTQSQLDLGSVNPFYSAWLRHVLDETELETNDDVYGVFTVEGPNEEEIITITVLPDNEENT